MRARGRSRGVTGRQAIAGLIGRRRCLEAASRLGRASGASFLMRRHALVLYNFIMKTDTCQKRKVIQLRLMITQISNSHDDILKREEFMR